MEERLKALEEAFVQLLDAIRRAETEQDGNWGWPSFSDELKRLRELFPKGK